MTEDEARSLKPGDSVEYHDRQQWKWAEVVEPYGPIECWPYAGVRVNTGTYKTVARPQELRF